MVLELSSDVQVQSYRGMVAYFHRKDYAIKTKIDEKKNTKQCVNSSQFVHRKNLNY